MRSDGKHFRNLPLLAVLAGAWVMGIGCGTDSTGEPKSSTNGNVSESQGDASTASPENVETAPRALHSVALSADGNDRLLGVARSERFVAAVGYTSVGADQAIAVMRFRNDGSRDTSFGDDGLAVVNATVGGRAKELARGVVALADGKIAVAGIAEHDPATVGILADDTDLVIMRLDTNGNLDSSFGAEGIVRLDLGTGVEGKDSSGSPAVVGADTGWGLTELANGDLLYVAGTRASDSARTDLDLALVRLDQKGQLVRSFGDQGVLRIDLNQGQESPRQAVSLADGSVVVCGYTTLQGVTSPVLVKITKRGKLDATFGTGGISNPKLLSVSSEAYSLAIQGDSFVITGYGKDDPTAKVDVISARFSANGKVDSTYGESGLLRVDLAGLDDRGRALTVLPDGRIFIVGSGSLPAGQDAMLVLADEQGTPHPEFGMNGVELVDLGGSSDAYFGSTLSPDRKSLFVVGYKGGDPAKGEDDAVLLTLPLSSLP